MSPLGHYNQAIEGLQGLFDKAIATDDSKMAKEMETMIEQLKNSLKRYVRRREKMRVVEKESRIISGFLDWLAEKSIDLCELADEHWFPIHTSHERLLAEHFDIDLDKVEEERRAMLEDIRSKQG